MSRIRFKAGVWLAHLNLSLFAGAQSSVQIVSASDIVAPTAVLAAERVVALAAALEEWRNRAIENVSYSQI